MNVLGKTLIAGIMATFCSFAQAERAIPSPSFPWYSEFDKSENPNRNWWCGHAALKMVTAFKSKKAPNYAGFFDGVKNAVKNQKSPVVTIGAYQPNWKIGHTWVIIGYNDNNNPKAPGDAYLFLRDDSQSYPTNPEMDDWITVKDFMKMMDAKDSNGYLYHANSYYEYIRNVIK